MTTAAVAALVLAIADGAIGLQMTRFCDRPIADRAMARRAIADDPIARSPDARNPGVARHPRLAVTVAARVLARSRLRRGRVRTCPAPARPRHARVSRAPACDGGFTLIESIVAMALMLVMIGAALAVMTPDTSIAAAEPEAADLQQRARAGRDALFRDLVAAGAGLSAGPATGSLAAYFPPVIPRIIGQKNADAYTVARDDAVTLVYVPDTPVQTSTSVDMPAASPQVAVNGAPNCVPAAPMCGFVSGVEALVFDRVGEFDVFSVTAVDDLAARLQHRGSSSSIPFPAGSYIAEAVSRTYYFDAVNHALRQYDGYSTDTPVIDDVVGVTFEYFGEPRPPTQPKPPAGVANCLYDASGNLRGDLATLGSGDGLVRLPLSLFSDGPWCGSGDTRVDADLLRIRTIRVSLRVEAAPAWLRGRGADYRLAGTSTSALGAVPDYTLTFDVSPRNLRIGP